MVGKQLPVMDLDDLFMTGGILSMASGKLVGYTLDVHPELSSVCKSWLLELEQANHN